MTHLDAMAPQSLRRRHSPATARQQAGSTLIEVLVAALILSIGIMALVGVQGSSMQMAKMAQQRGEASRLAQDLADRMRANANLDTLKNVYFREKPTYSGNVAVQVIPATCKGKTSCPSEDIAKLDLAEMREQARLALNGVVYIAGEELAGGAAEPDIAIDIWVIWQTASTKSDDTGTLTGTGCPEGAVSAGTKNVQCLLTRVML